MTTVPVVAPTGREPRSFGAGVRRHGGTVVAVVTVGFLDVVFAVFAALTPGAPGWVEVWAGFGVLAALASGVSMVWRTSHPGWVLVANAASTLLLPLSPLGVLVALPWVLARADPSRARWSVVLTVAVTGVALARDALREPPGVVLATSPSTGDVQVLAPYAYVIVGVALVAIAVGVGMLRRYRESARIAEGAVQAQVTVSTQLRGELNRQEERDLIAREMHDTVAHHLSLVSLHAAALEVTTSDPGVPESARAMRSSAHQALEEMRGLITSLRDSSEGGYTGVAPSLSRLPQLLADARDAGASIEADLIVHDGDQAAPVLTRAVYRIVQEALTNAIKHSPSSPVRVRVRAEPSYGVEIFVANWSGPAQVRDSTGSGAGLLGMRERAAALGGTLTAAPDGEAWVVRAWLPWRGGGQE